MQTIFQGHSFLKIKLHMAFSVFLKTILMYNVLVLYSTSCRWQVEISDDFDPSRSTIDIWHSQLNLQWINTSKFKEPRSHHFIKKFTEYCKTRIKTCLKCIDSLWFIFRNTNISWINVIGSKGIKADTYSAMRYSFFEQLLMSLLSESSIPNLFHWLYSSLYRLKKCIFQFLGSIECKRNRTTRRKEKKW